MDFEITFDDDAQIAIVRTSGKTSPPDITACLRALVSDPRWRTGMNVLSDHSSLDAGDLTADDIESIVYAHLPFAEAIGPGLYAIVTGSTLKFGLARMFEAHAAGQLAFRIRIFAAEDEALEWLTSQGRTSE